MVLSYIKLIWIQKSFKVYKIWKVVV